MNLQALLNLLDAHYPNISRDTIFIYRVEGSTLSIRDEVNLMEDEAEGVELVAYDQSNGHFFVPWEVYLEVLPESRTKYGSTTEGIMII